MATTPVTKPEIVASLGAARRRTLGLLDPIPESAQRTQVSELMSPLCWDLAHIGHFEELWLVRELTGAAPSVELYDDIYDAFKHPAPRPTVVADPRPPQAPASSMPTSAVGRSTSSSAPHSSATIPCAPTGSSTAWWCSTSTSTARRCWRPSN